MRNSDADQASQQLDMLVRALDPAHLERIIDAPVDAVVTGLLRQPPTVASAREFHLAIGGFVREISATASPTRLVLSQEEALAVAIEILNHDYGAPGQGYDDALVDVLQNGSQTVEGILQSLAEGIKARERSKYVNWVLTISLHCLSWSVKCAMVELINNCCGTPTGQRLLENDPGRFAGVLPELVTAHVRAVYAAQLCGK